MLNLSEEWKKAYTEFLKEEEESFDKEIDGVCAELMEAQEEISKSYSLLETYYSLYLNEAPMPVGTTLSMDNAGNVDIKYPENKVNERRPERADSATIKSADDVKKVFSYLMSQANDEKISNKDTQYVPLSTYTYEKISDMKFPQNIIFFIGQFIKWIRNVVIYFIEKFKNLIRKLVGAKPKELDVNKVQLNLTRLKKIESSATPMEISAPNKNTLITGLRVPQGSVELLEGKSMAELLGIALPDRADVKKEQIVVTVDLSRDIINLKQLVQHFYDLFDNAYGSSNEKLFETGDLEVIFKLFKSAISNVKTGEVNIYAIGGQAIETSGINKERVKQNLIVTNQNMNALKEAYMQTSAKIQDIAKIINSKEMMMLTSMGVSYKLLTSSTYEQMKGLLTEMPERIKSATKMEKDLSRMQDQYNRLVKELSSMQNTVSNISAITYDTIYNRKMVELLNAANWMSQIVSLRLAGIGLYIKELKDVRDVLLMLVKTNDVK